MEREVIMTCQRCHGLMVHDRVLDVEAALLDLPIWRCVNCGESLDPILLRNRQSQDQHSKTLTAEVA